MEPVTGVMETLTDTTEYDYNGTAAMEFVCDSNDSNDFAKHFLPPFYYIIFIFSILGNGVVLLVICKFEKLNTVTNIFLINLVASNVFFTLSLPFLAIFHSDQWVFGEAMCKLVNAADRLGFYSSILFLTLMAFDRYLAVVHCVAASRQRRTCYAVALSSVVWSISLLASSDAFVHFTVQDYPKEGLLCEDSSEPQWKVFSFYKQFLLFFIFPLSMFIYCYFRITLTVMSTRMSGKIRSIRLIFVVVLMFFFFWSPHNIVLMMKENQDPDDCESLLQYAEYVTANIARFYFCVNPVFYTFLGRKFQNHVRGVLKNQVSCLSSQTFLSGSSRTLS